MNHPVAVFSSSFAQNAKQRTQPSSILGTGGTIAGTAAQRRRQHRLHAPAQLGVDAAGGRRAGAGAACRSRPSRWRSSTARTWTSRSGAALARRVAHHLARAEVAGVVVTHGTDTLEETAYFLQRVLAPAKPVVLTAAMRPATALLRRRPAEPARCGDAWRAQPGARGVVAVLAGRVHAAPDVRKVHTYRVDAFGSGDAGPLARVEEGRAARACATGRRARRSALARLPADAATGRGSRSSPATPAPAAQVGARAGDSRRARPRRRRHRQRQRAPRAGSGAAARRRRRA